ncbi:hypothetical protein PQJ75_15695 [Rhodoplanes sp. TEM]|uniref:Uncharacterized protein n=1 Tax=Rhodoplanes tepidamans TaxID=200616 RepID=A0ABT5J5T6_RHOTP|nr:MULTISPECIES: hypothetical protein [Rhodoplanes]MDC7784400.1 hypothetical protein [Rhodoplanes tepidamans]MDC7985179.1 hypothetical protein [Rhodoplanes sp. TEM]MDQ0354471.1 hypothetical protein [Rhodoplanes tepidamans]
MTSDEIVAILGPIDEVLLAEIVQTGASPAELAEAWAWVNADEALVNDGRALPTGRVAVLVDMLTPAADDDV